MGLKKYLAARLVQSLIVIYIVMTIVFFMVRAIPGDPARLLLGGDAPQQAIQALRKEMGLNQPLHIQYIRWLGDMLTGDFGTSAYTNQPVLEMIINTAPPTLSIAGLGILLAFLIGIPTGIISAVRRYSVEDYAATFVAFIGISMPGFWIGIILLLVFANWIQIVPVFGYVPITHGVIPWFKHLILPAIAVGLPYGGIIMRMTRSSMLEVLSKDYMRTAKAKGLSSNLVVFKHGLQNALIPVVTISGILLGVLLAGSVAVELVFGIHGFGRLLISAINRRDFPVIQASVILIAVIFVFMNLFIDLLYTGINPQITYGEDETA